MYCEITNRNYIDRQSYNSKSLKSKNVNSHLIENVTKFINMTKLNCMKYSCIQN